MANILNLLCWRQHPPLSMGCPQGFTEPLWGLIPIPENHKEMVRESNFPDSPCYQYVPSLRVVKGKVSGARCLNSNPGSAHYFVYDFGENCLVSLCLSFLTCKMGIFVEPTSRCIVRITWTNIFKAHSPHLAHWKCSLQGLVDLVNVLRKTRLYLKRLKILAHYWLTAQAGHFLAQEMRVLISLWVLISTCIHTRKHCCACLIFSPFVNIFLEHRDQRVCHGY